MRIVFLIILFLFFNIMGSIFFFSNNDKSQVINQKYRYRDGTSFPCQAQTEARAQGPGGNPRAEQGQLGGGKVLQQQQQQQDQQNQQQ